MVGLQQDEVEVPQQVRYGSAKPKLVGSWLQGTEDVAATGWPMHFHGAKPPSTIDREVFQPLRLVRVNYWLLLHTEAMNTHLARLHLEISIPLFLNTQCPSPSGYK